MDIESEKLNLVKEILQIDSQELILKIKNILLEENELSNMVNEPESGYQSTSKTNRKLNFIKDFINLENEETIIKLENLLWKNNDFWNDLSFAEKEEIEQGIKELDEGKKISWEDFLVKTS